ncbi:MAG: DnaB-like helicase N-terminal domain-containing protein, partial [Desulfobaccales bacterium]
MAEGQAPGNVMAMARKIIPIKGNLEAEQSVLGAILVRPECLDRIASLIEPADFSIASNARIFKAMVDLSRRGAPVDLVTVTSLLDARGELPGVGGPIFLAELSEQVGFATNADYYAACVKDKALLREFREAAEDVSQACKGQIEDVNEFLNDAETRLLAVIQRNKDRKLPSWDKAILEVSEFIIKETPERQIYLDPWLKEATINLVTAWRGIGKSNFIIAILMAVSRGESFGPWQISSSVPSLYFDGEMVQQDTIESFSSLFKETGERKNLFIYSDHYCNLLGLPPANLLDENWRHWMKDVLVERGIKLWALDNIASATPGMDEDSREAWGPINRWLLGLRFAGISTILVHHEGKTGLQRGTSGREDNLDFSISLKRPRDYRPEDGARFICHFEKARITRKDLHRLVDLEFQMDELDGKTIWTYRNLKKESTG